MKHLKSNEKQKKREEFSDRLIAFAAGCYHLTLKLKNFIDDKNTINQLIRSATSTGANYEEACGAESRKDFIHKIQIVLKEIREANFWLRFIARVRPNLLHEAEPLMKESKELIRIISKTLITTKKNI